MACQRHTNPHHLNGVRSTFAARRPSAKCDRWWIIRCKIAPPRGKGRRGKSPSICKEHLKTENLNDLPNFLRCSPNTRHRRPGLWTEPQKVLHEPTHLLGDLEKGKSKGNVGTSTFFRNCEPRELYATKACRRDYHAFSRRPDFEFR